MPSRCEPVAVAAVAGGYPAAFPYDPGEPYPEYRGAVAAAPNPVYAAVRESFRLLGLDAARFGMPSWSPLAGLVRPGDRVFIKPNLVTHEVRRSCRGGGDLYAIITHPSVVRAVADYAAIALHGRGEIVIGDNPSIDADFARLDELTGLGRFAGLYAERFATACRVLDLRPLRTAGLADYGYASRALAQAGDPEPEVVLDLGERSSFHGLSPRGLRGVFTDRAETMRRHRGGRHEYAISGTVMNADVYVSIPKLKAHHKVGATLNVKGLVGINARKNFLPHWRVGTPETGGDEYPPGLPWSDRARLRLRQLASDVAPEALARRVAGSALDRWLCPVPRHGYVAFRGAWQGNDTCWRMAADLYRAFVSDATGWCSGHEMRRRTFSVVDGVVGGEGDGPFCPRPREARVIVAGSRLLAVDAVATRLMDFAPEAVPYLRELLREEGLETGAIPIASDLYESVGFFDPARSYLEFQPPAGWPRLALRRQPGGQSDAPHHPCGGQGRAALAAHAQHAQAAP